MFGKIAIRNISPEIWGGLEFLASKHDRSTEAEARFAIRSWVEPLLQRNERSARRKEVSARLREMLEQVNGAIHGRSIKPSHIAAAIGEEYAEGVENWFSGEFEPSFKQLDSVARYLGGVSEWLQHGDNQMFPVESIRIPEDPAEGVKWLLDLADADEKVSFLHIVREGDEAGALAIVKQYGSWRCKTYITPYHVSEVIGAGGEASLAHISLILELLYKSYTKSGMAGLVIKSYILPPGKCRTLFGGQMHPLTLLRGGIESPWWEDFWDVTQFRSRNSEYWPGWKSLCERIHRVVELKPHLLEQREAIRSGNYPLFQRSSFQNPSNDS